MKNIAIITGASSGIGKRFAETVDMAGSFDEIWVIARNPERLEALKETVPFPTRTIALDLSEKASYAAFEALLAEEKPNVRLLVNCSGFGKFSATLDTPLSITYMEKGAKIINIASVAAFQPIPYINIYGATKSFVLSYSRALNREMKNRGINVTAVCPFWTKTEFFNRAIAAEKDPVVKKYVAMYEPDQIVKRAWRDMKKDKDVSMYGFIARGQVLLTKLLPHKLVMSVWQNQQKLK